MQHERADEVRLLAVLCGGADVSRESAPCQWGQRAFRESTRRFCTVNVTMNGGRVTRINYVGPTGGLLTASEQCAFAVEKCAPH